MTVTKTLLVANVGLVGQGLATISWFKSEWNPPRVVHPRLYCDEGASRVSTVSVWGQRDSWLWRLSYVKALLHLNPISEDRRGGERIWILSKFQKWSFTSWSRLSRVKLTSANKPDKSFWGNNCTSVRMELLRFPLVLLCLCHEWTATHAAGCGEKQYEEDGQCCNMCPPGKRTKYIKN